MFVMKNNLSQMIMAYRQNVNVKAADWRIVNKICETSKQNSKAQPFTNERFSRAVIMHLSKPMSLDYFWWSFLKHD